MKNNRKLVVIGFLILLGLFVWVYRQLSRPLPGEAVADQGRDHVAVGTIINYNSNPPTSGPHYEDSTKAGIYNEPIEDGYLVHSLEHGYIVISYKCQSRIEEQGAESEQECQDLTAKLAGIFEKKGKKKIIIVSRPSLDIQIALTAWRRIDKIESFDEERIIKFIDAFRDHGPEKTAE